MMLFPSVRQTALFVTLCSLNSASIGAELLQEQILVTATRVPQQAALLPLSWSTVDQEALALTRQVHINEIMQRVPGAWIARGNGQESLPSMRSPVLTGAGSCGAFFMAEDGIGLRAPGFCNVNQLFDANSEQAGRIEVIKGPATALYGSNAMHGVINILSAAPTEQLDHQLAVEAGLYDYYRGRYHYRNTRGAHGISVNINGVSDGGYKDDSGYDQQKLTLRHDYAGQVWGLRSVLGYSNLNQETAGFIRGYKSYEDEDLKDTNPNPEAYRDVRSLRAHTRASRELGNGSTLTLTPYLRHNEMEFLMHFLPWQPLEENGHSSLGLQAVVHTSNDRWNWSNGVEVEYTDGWLEETQEEPFVSNNQPAGVHYDYQVDALNGAAFSQFSYAPGNNWTLEGGLRLEYTEYDYDNRTGDGSPCVPEATACRFYRPSDRKDDFSDFSFNLGASYTFSDSHMGYIRLARGFRAPQATELYRLQSGQQVADLDSEEIDNIELGFRGRLGELAYDLSVYHMEKDEVIFQDANRQNISGAKTQHDGLEISLDYAFAESGYLGLDATYARHQYDSRIALIGSSGDIKGNDIDTAPRVFGSARLGWDFTNLLNREAQAELEWVYLGSHYLEPDNKHEYGGHSLLNARMTVAITPQWQGALRVTNLLDEDYAERADFGFGDYRYFVGQPLGAYLEVSYRFAAN